MEITSLYAIGSVIFGAFCISLLACSVIDAIKRANNGALIRLRARSTEDLNFQSLEKFDLKSYFLALITGGISAFSKISSLFIKVHFIKDFFEKLARALTLKKINSEPKQLLESFIALELFLISFSALLFRSIPLCVCLFLLPMVAIWIFTNKTLSNHRDLLERQMPDAFRALGVYYSSGLTFSQSIKQAAKEIGGPLGAKFKEVSDKLEAGETMQESLCELRNCGSEQLEFLAIVLEIQQRTGGSLQDLLEKAALSVSASQDLARSLKTQTAASRMSAKIVTIMPLAIFGLIALTNKESISSFFSSGVGVFMFCLAICMQIIGVLVVRKILGVDIK